MGKSYEMGPTFIATVSAFVRAGGFPHVASEAAGIPKEVFEKWLSLGCPLDRKKHWKPHPRYTPLWQAVMEAKAQARLKAEMKALEDNPEGWLTKGPGKDKPGDPGWSRIVKPAVNETNNTVNVLLQPEMQGLFATLLQLLPPSPERRAVLDRALAGERKPPRIVDAREPPSS